MSWIIGNFLPFVIILTILVFVHELGHFLVARRNGVKVTAFSIGFGPEIFGWTDRQQTRWRFSLIPLGGYVKMLGDADPSSTKTNTNIDLTEEEKKQTLHSKTQLQQIKIAAAGPFANFIFTIFALFGLMMFKGVPHLAPVIGKVEPGMLAAMVDMRAGDKILKVNGGEIDDFYKLRRVIVKLEGKDAEFEIERSGQVLTKVVSFYEVDQKTKQIKVISKLGITPTDPTYTPQDVFNSLVQSIKLCLNLIVETLQGLGDLLLGNSKASELGGILSIGDMAAQSTRGGVAAVVWLMAILSVNLGVINLLPIPVLDGGHILICAIHGIRGKPLSSRVQDAIFFVGFAIVAATMVFSMWNDLTRYKVFQIIKGWF